VNPVISPQGEVKSEFEIFQLLADRLGFGRRCQEVLKNG
jgi:hypothetical protein